MRPKNLGETCPVRDAIFSEQSQRDPIGLSLPQGVAGDSFSYSASGDDSDDVETDSSFWIDGSGGNYTEFVSDGHGDEGDSGEVDDPSADPFAYTAYDDGTSEYTDSDVGGRVAPVARPPVHSP